MSALTGRRSVAGSIVDFAVTFGVYMFGTVEAAVKGFWWRPAVERCEACGHKVRRPVTR